MISTVEYAHLWHNEYAKYLIMNQEIYKWFTVTYDNNRTEWHMMVFLLTGSRTSASMGYLYQHWGISECEQWSGRTYLAMCYTKTSIEKVPSEVYKVYISGGAMHYAGLYLYM